MGKFAEKAHPISPVTFFPLATTTWFTMIVLVTWLPGFLCQLITRRASKSFDRVNEEVLFLDTRSLQVYHFNNILRDSFSTLHVGL